MDEFEEHDFSLKHDWPMLVGIACSAVILGGLVAIVFLAANGATL